MGVGQIVRYDEEYECVCVCVDLIKVGADWLDNMSCLKQKWLKKKRAKS